MTNPSGKPGPIYDVLDDHPRRVFGEPFNSLLTEAGFYVTAVNTANGWFEGDRSFGDEIALIASELFEAFEAYRKRGLKRWVTDEEGTTWLVGEPDDDNGCLLYTSDAADERSSVDLG